MLYKEAWRNLIKLMVLSNNNRTEKYIDKKKRAAVYSSSERCELIKTIL